MTEMAPRLMIGLPMVLILAVLVVFGITWMFHHHHWKPVVGIFLFVFGMFFLLAFTRFSAEQEQRGPRDGMGTTTTSFSTGDEPKMRSDHQAEKPPSSAPPAVASGPKTAERSNSGTGSDYSASPDKRPDWVDRPPGLQPRDDGTKVYVTTVTSGLWATPSECRRAIGDAENDAVARYIADYVPDAGSQEVNLEPGYIRKRIVSDEYWEKVTRSVGDMNQLYVKLVFDGRVLDDFRSRAREAVVNERLKSAAGGTALALLMLGGIYSILKRGAAPRASAQSQ